MDRERRQTSGGGGHGRSAAALGGGGAPVILWPRKMVSWMRLEVAKLCAMRVFKRVDGNGESSGHTGGLARRALRRRDASSQARRERASRRARQQLGRVGARPRPYRAWTPRPAWRARRGRRWRRPWRPRPSLADGLFLGPDGLARGRSGIGVGPLGSAQKGRLDFFFS
jgi:hypothetical protein